MSGERWTLLVVKGEDAPLRQISVSRTALRSAIAAVGIAAAAFLILTVQLLIRGGERVHAERLTRENQILAQELERMRDRAGHLESRLGQLAEQSERLRTLTGLEGIDSDVLEVGVGGPGGAAPEFHPLRPVDPELSEAAFAVEYDLAALERRARLLSESLSEAADTLVAHHDLLRSTPSILPTAGLLSSRFSDARPHPIHHRSLPHEGIDIAAERGTPILAAAKGTVITARWKSGYGQTVEVDHGYGFVTLYGHASEILVREGDVVERGDVIAQVGRTGIATSPHLHYKIRVGGRPVNPMNYVLTSSVP